MSNAQRLAAVENAVVSLAESVGRIALAVQNAPQFSTPAAVAEAVAPTTEAPKVSLVKEPVVSPEDALLNKTGLKRATGGHAVLSGETLVACARVLKTGTPEIVAVTRDNLKARNVTHILVARDGAEVVTQYLYTPKA